MRSTWGIRFIAAKCKIVCVSWKRTLFTFTYSVLTGEPLQKVAEAKYLEWTKHFQNVTVKGNSKLAILRRNLSGYPEILKEIAYFSLVRSSLEYSSAVPP